MKKSNFSKYPSGFIGLLVIFSFIINLLPPDLSAQYFGRNKVQYENFSFKIIHTEHFKIYYYPSEEEAALDAARMAERWYDRLSRVMEYTLSEPKPIILYANHPDFQQTNVISGLISEGTGGVTEAMKNRVVLPLTGNYQDTDHVLGHELVHAFQYDMALRAGMRGLQSLSSLPLWAIEGLAEYLSVGREDSHTAMWMRDALLYNDLPTISQMSRDPRYFPYRFGQALWAFIAGKWGDQHATQLYKMAASQGWDISVENVLEMRTDSLSQLWIESLRHTYSPLIEGRTRPEDAGKRILAPDKDAGEMNLSPVISPDGQYVVFLSEKDIFSIDLFLADAETGEIIKKLASADRDAHFDALSFMNASGTWSPDNKQFAFIVVAKGDNQIVITDVESGAIRERIHFKEIGAISNPAWSPDGRYIAFSGIRNGKSDLFLYELSTGELQQLTDGRHADLQPAWSPDGSTIAFITDRNPRTNFENLNYSDMQLALLDVDTRQIRQLNLFENGKHINPQFSPDGNSIYFVSDQDGYSDIYRLELASGNIFRITTLATGVSGISNLSPAISVSPQTGRMLFTVFERSNYVVYGLEENDARGQPVGRQAESQPLAGILPPHDALQTSMVEKYLANYERGMIPSGAAFKITDYSPSLQLDYIGQPTIGVAVDRFGTALGGGVSAYFSDMLGNHVLGMALQANGGFKDIGGQVFYMNRDNRWNWGGALAHIPYISLQTSARAVNVDVGGGQSVRGTLIEQFRDRVFVDALEGIMEYPLSQTNRFEFVGGFTRISYDREIERIVTVGGQTVEREIVELDAPPGLNLLQTAAAYVGDYSAFGFTSPTRGGRYRFEIQPTIGTLNFVSALADFRRYFFFNPLTIGFRMLHYGRYGQDSESNRMTPLFLGYETFVRGYDPGSFDLAECTPDPDNPENCPEFDRLVGSRIAVANLELRIPLFGVERYGLINFPYFPTELTAFFDAGMAWTGSEFPDLTFERETAERVPVFSTGFSARVNLFGYFVIETYYAYPFQRPNKGWHFGFQIAPGW